MRGPERRQRLFQQLDQLSVEFDWELADDDMFDDCEVTTSASTSASSISSTDASCDTKPQDLFHHVFRDRIYRQFDDKHANLANMAEIMMEVARDETEIWTAQLLAVLRDIELLTAFHTESVPLWFAPTPKKDKDIKVEATPPSTLQKLQPTDIPVTTTKTKTSKQSSHTSKAKSKETPLSTLNPVDTPKQSTRIKTKPQIVTGASVKNQLKQFEKIKEPARPPPRALCVDGTKLIKPTIVPNTTHVSFRSPIESDFHSPLATKFASPKTPTFPSPTTTKQAAMSPKSNSPRPIKGNKINAMAQFFEGLE